jgi:vancomycin resistance protein YoaR
MNMSRKRSILTAVFLLLISFLLGGNAIYASAEENDNTICKGVFIDEVDVSGMTKAEAELAIDDFVENLRGRGIAIMVGDDVVYSTLGDFGYNYEPNDNIDQALALGKSGNLIKRYKDLKDIEQGSIILPLTFSFDEKKIKDLVKEDVSAYNVEPVDATVTRKSGEFVYTDHVVGSKVNVDQTTQAIQEAIKNWNRQDIIVEAVLEDDLPIYTRDVVEKCNTVLGTYTTEYTDSAEGRAANLANGARLINNAIIYPGEVFSSYEYLTPFTEKNGYYVAGAYLQGKIIDSVGGGACQVTTTLYNAVLASELEVVERQPHSMTISYVDLSRDAAIAGTYKDFKFKNNTDVPILIEATTVGRKITFKVWGNETRDTKNRKIEYVTVVTSETPPPADVITKDPTQPTSYRKVTQSAHTGYKAELYKVIYENDVEISRTRINKSNYSAAPRYVTVGTKVEEEKKEDTEKDPSKIKDTDDKKQDQNQNQNQDQDNEQSNTETQSQSTETNNLANPDNQLQADTWDPSWDDEGLEDE